MYQQRVFTSHLCEAPGYLSKLRPNCAPDASGADDADSALSRLARTLRRAGAGAACMTGEEPPRATAGRSSYACDGVLDTLRPDMLSRPSVVDRLPDGKLADLSRCDTSLHAQYSLA